jgi:phenylacetate-CoA ligase
MIHDWKMELYWRLPVFLQETALSFYARRLERIYYGPGYKEWYERFKSWKAWSNEEGRAWQSQQLQAIVRLAATRVPYYRDKWKKNDWKSIRSAEDLSLLPLLDKRSLHQNEQAFLVEGLNPNSLWMDRTSGTTGAALKIYWPLPALPKWWALTEVMVRNAAGVAQEIPRAMMGGRTVVPGTTKQPPYWRFNRRWQQLYLSSYHVSRDTARDYVGAIHKYGSEWIIGYGSAIAALADSALEARLSPHRLRVVITSGDTLLPGMRSSIEQFFQCRCVDLYGQSEYVAMAVECSQKRMHVVPAAGILEILREDGSPCLPGEVGEIVATGLLNDAMPLIRYRVGDCAAWAEDQNCRCGNSQAIIANLEGRVDDYVITSAGRKIGRLAGFRRGTRIHSAQLVQDSLDHAFLLVRPGQEYSCKDALAVRNDILSRVDNLEIDIVEVPEIPKTPQGKQATVVRLFDRPDMRRSYEKLLGDANRRTA